MYASTVESLVATADTAASVVGPAVAPINAVVEAGATVVELATAAATTMLKS